MTLFSNGDNAIYLRRDCGTNWGMYVTGDAGYTHGANAKLVRPNSASRILLSPTALLLAA